MPRSHLSFACVGSVLAGLVLLLTQASSAASAAASASQPPLITSADHAVFDVLAVNSFTVTATGSPAPTFAETGSLPAGVTLSSSGVLSGAPDGSTLGNRYPIQITASNSAGTVTQAFTLVADEPFTSLPVGGVLGDVTGDGRADILAIGQYVPVSKASNLYLYPNTGSIGADMFAGGRSQVGTGWAGYTLAAVGPLYGSARAGILAMDPTGNLWYYPNTGGTGFGTFGARSKVGTGWTGYTVVGLTDLHGTGQPGILARDSAGNLWYYPNTGGSGLGTFGARSKVGSGWTGYTADVADINGDGRPDLVGVDGPGDVWLYPNTGGSGTSTFGARIQVSYGVRSYIAIDAGQLTGTGPAQMLAVDQTGRLFFWPNSGGTGDSTFGQPVQVGTGWVGYAMN